SSFLLLSFSIILPYLIVDLKLCNRTIVDTQLKNNEVILSGEIPARCIQEYRSDLTFFTNGRSVCLTELKGYHVTTGEPVCQPRRPNSRIDKVRYMFNKIT
ncbi:elongation factor G, partial [Enterococcus faecium]